MTQELRDMVQLLWEHDVIGLRSAGCPEDEYSPEAAPILEQLKNCHDVLDIQNMVYQVFVDMFDEQVAGKNDDRYWQLADDIADRYSF